jgi:hypothetical protein
MEAKVREATNDEPWCASTPFLQRPYSHPYLQGSKLNLDAGDRSRVCTVITTPRSRQLTRKKGRSICKSTTSFEPQTPLSARSQTFNEIMPCIYGRFMEKEARQWRQIYKVSYLAILMRDRS